ncbi:MAG: hypothetical protein PHW25_17405 [Zoogloea sp.]|uniref:hypothetical protein n=1 Tax=Zoogloea sp. TaxID=49181 RepID=UPI00261DA65A|nr:hypothetical protein [Zoogloea sp.]MDD3328861.1 hypothetical protein [Zoogloea sp.]
MAEAKKQPKVRALRISSRPETRRRAGRVWSRTPQDVPLSELTDDAVKLLKGDPLIVVQEVEIDPPADTEAEPQ